MSRDLLIRDRVPPDSRSNRKIRHNWGGRSCDAFPCSGELFECLVGAAATQLYRALIPAARLGDIFDRLLDMVRTAVNVVGDASVSCIVAASEGQLSREIFRGETDGA